MSEFYPYDQIERFDHWKDLTIGNKRYQEIFESNRRGQNDSKDMCFFYVGMSPKMDPVVFGTSLFYCPGFVLKLAIIPN